MILWSSADASGGTPGGFCPDRLPAPPLLNLIQANAAIPTTMSMTTAATTGDISRFMITSFTG